MTQVENHPVRWCPNPECKAPSTIPEDEWREIERKDEEVLCANCLERPPRLWLTEKPQ